MKITCPYCGNLFESSNAQCPHCLAPNDAHPDVENTDPTTIDELKKWYSDRHLPPYETTRFFIGENVSAPRAFGIYRQGEQVIVYKNKDNGQRSVRYSGSDEGYAVSEIFSKLKDEILHQKELSFNANHSLPSQSQPQSTQSSAAPAGRNRMGCLTKLLIVLAIVLLLSFLFGRSSTPSQGYYSYNGNSYYQQNNNWYSYNNGSWNVVPVVPGVLLDDPDDYYEGDSYNGGSSQSSFDNSSSSGWSSSSGGSSVPSSNSNSNNYSSNNNSTNNSTNNSSNDWDWDNSDNWDSSNSSSDWNSNW